MNLAKMCKLCEYYIPHGKSKNQGVCDRVGDPGFTYSVSAEREICLYDSPGLEISEEEHFSRLRKKQEELAHFEESTKTAIRIVNSWPNRKRELANRMLRPNKNPK
jgi:hypothetical protein